MLSTLWDGPETTATIHPDFQNPHNDFSVEASTLDRTGLEAIYRRLHDLGLAAASDQDHDGFEPAPEGQLVAWYSLTAEGEDLLEANSE